MIVFKNLYWQNFLSTGNTKTKLSLTRNVNTLISGENGAGKSTMLDALTFVLFGKSFRGNNIPQLVNSINNKNCLVEIEFSIGDKEYRVRRGLKPKIFEIFIDGELLPQDSKSKDYQRIFEEKILGMSYKAFCQVVVLGSTNYVPFMKLTAADRRSVVENLLDIDVFSSMNTVLKSKVSLCKEEISRLDNQRDLLEYKIDNQKKYIQKIQNQSDDLIKKHTDDIKETEKTIESVEKEISELNDNLSSLVKSHQDKEKIDKQLTRYSDVMKQLKTKIERSNKKKKHYENEDVCSSCKQTISEEHRQELLNEIEEECSPVYSAIEEVEQKIQEYTEKQAEIQKVFDEMTKIQEEIRTKTSSKSASQKYIQSIREEIEKINTNSHELSAEQTTLDTLFEEQNTTQTELNEQKELFHNYELLSVLLKDSGIKSRIIKQYLPVMNKLVNKYLSSMGFFCSFYIDENFNETIRSRYRDEFTYVSFSEGERLRIDLALLLAWREIARMKNSLNCNLLILDEVFDSSLDSVGTEEFMKLLVLLGRKTNVFVISHKSDSMTDKFENHIVFEKKNNFSRIK